MVKRFPRVFEKLAASFFSPARFFSVSFNPFPLSLDLSSARFPLERGFSPSAGEFFQRRRCNDFNLEARLQHVPRPLPTPTSRSTLASRSFAYAEGKRTFSSCINVAEASARLRATFSQERGGKEKGVEGSRRQIRKRADDEGKERKARKKLRETSRNTVFNYTIE